MGTWEGSSWCIRADRHVVGVNVCVCLCLCVTLGFQDERLALDSFKPGIRHQTFNVV